MLQLVVSRARRINANSPSRAYGHAAATHDGGRLRLPGNKTNKSAVEASVFDTYERVVNALLSPSANSNARHEQCLIALAICASLGRSFKNQVKVVYTCPSAALEDTGEVQLTAQRTYVPSWMD